MARILIQPEELARLARRFDAAADELTSSGRRLSRRRDEVRLNRADDAFSFARFVERSTLVEGGLRRLAAEFRIDAGLMARTVDDAELDGDGEWTLGLLSGVGPGVGGGAGAAGPVVGSVTSVVTGLASLSNTVAAPDEVAPASTRSIGAGGLFVLSSTGGGSQDMLLRVTERLAASSPGHPEPDTGAATGDVDAGAAGAVWTRIVDELFAGGEDP